MEDSTIEVQKKLMQYDPLLWANFKRLSLRDGVKFSLKDMPYLCDLVNQKKKEVSVKKGAQVCLTTSKFLESVHSCVYRKYDQNIMYMMPTVTAAEKLSKVSFDPIFDYNSWLKKMVSTNTAAIKEINGRSIVFVGAQPKSVGGNVKDSDNLRSIPCDAVLRDEIDLMDADMVYMSKQRLKRSKFAHEFNFGSPTYPDFGIDELYEASDQHKWQIKCGSCGKYTCLAETFPDSVCLINSRWVRCCVHCKSEIHVNDGAWVAEYPDRRKGGYWVSGLLSPYADLEEFMYQWDSTEGKRRCEFMRSSLGIASIESENQLSEQDVLANCSSEPCQLSSLGETVMGVDVGSTMHAVIGIRTGRDSYDILDVRRVQDFDELYDIGRKMNVKVCVIDAMPDIHATKDFVNSAKYPVYRCYYSETMSSKPTFDPKENVVKVNRNEICDKVYDSFVSSKVRIPRQSPEIKKFAYQATRTARRVEEHPETGIPKPKWIKLGGGEDHYFHAMGYFLLAASRSTSRKRHETQTKRPKYTKFNYAI